LFSFPEIKEFDFRIKKLPTQHSNHDNVDDILANFFNELYKSLTWLIPTSSYTHLIHALKNKNQGFINQFSIIELKL